MELRDYLIRRLYLEFLTSRDFEPYFNRLHGPPPRWRYILAIPFALTGVGIGIAAGLIWSAWRDTRRRNQARQAILAAAQRSMPIMAYPVMVNRALLRQTGVMAPGLVVGAFEPDRKISEMADLIERMSDIRQQDVSHETKVAVRQMFRDEAYTPGRRRVVPEELTGGKRVYAFDLMLFSDYLPTDRLEFPLIPCMAEPGDQGTIQMLPWWIVAAALEVVPAGKGDETDDP